jgi:hypothetical protein
MAAPTPMFLSRCEFKIEDEYYDNEYDLPLLISDPSEQDLVDWRRFCILFERLQKLDPLLNSISLSLLRLAQLSKSFGFPFLREFCFVLRSNSYITSLRLQDIDCKGGDLQLQSKISSTLLRSLPHSLEALELGPRSGGSSAGETEEYPTYLRFFENSLKAVRASSITSLSLGYSRLGEGSKHIEVFAAALDSGYLLNLEHLSLAHNPSLAFQPPEVLGLLGFKIATCLPNLRHLDLTNNMRPVPPARNSTSADEVQAFFYAKSLCASLSFCTTLETLSITVGAIYRDFPAVCCCLPASLKELRVDEAGIMDLWKPWVIDRERRSKRKQSKGKSSSTSSLSSTSVPSIASYSPSSSDPLTTVELQHQHQRQLHHQLLNLQQHQLQQQEQSRQHPLPSQKKRCFDDTFLGSDSLVQTLGKAIQLQVLNITLSSRGLQPPPTLDFVLGLRKLAERSESLSDLRVLNVRNASWAVAVSNAAAVGRSLRRVDMNGGGGWSPVPLRLDEVLSSFSFSSRLVSLNLARCSIGIPTCRFPGVGAGDFSSSSPRRPLIDTQCPKVAALVALLRSSQCHLLDLDLSYNELSNLPSMAAR